MILILTTHLSTNHRKSTKSCKYLFRCDPDRRNSFRITQQATDHCSSLLQIVLNTQKHLILDVFMSQSKNCFHFRLRACAVQRAARGCRAHWSRPPASAPFYMRESCDRLHHKDYPGSVCCGFGFWNPCWRHSSMLLWVSWNLSGSVIL